MTTFTREDVELYVMNELDGDETALEAALAEDPSLRAIAAEEAELEMLLRDAAADAVFCVGCGDLAGADRCVACGVAVEPGGYVVDRVLVSNAHGRMYVARDADGKQVALKELAFVQTPALDTIAMFEREAKVLRALEHPAIPRFVASFEEGHGVHTRYYLAQELVTGESLERKLEDHFFTETEILDLGRQVLEVLVYLQSVSPMIIHRDIKPANLIQKPDGKIAVVDFGAAHVQGTTAGSTSIGTFGYMPIEQLAGQVDATTDVYALGASLIHLLSRREPWRLLQGASLEGINVSPAIRDFLAKLVATEPSQRFANANAALEGLEHAARGGRIMPIVARRPRRFARPIMLAATAVGLAAAGYGARALTAADTSAPPGRGRLTVSFYPVEEAPLYIDNVSWGRVGPMFTVELEAGEHFVRVGSSCRESVMVEEGKPEFVSCEIKPSDLLAGTLVVDLVGRPTGKLFVDNKLVSNYLRGGTRTELPSGRRTIRIVSEDGRLCERPVEIEAGKVTSLVCELGEVASSKPSLPSAPTIPAGKQVDLEFKQTSLHDVLRTVADVCGLNAVVPDHVDAKITINLKKAPCNGALEVLLESHGLWYRYDPPGNMISIMPRNAIDRDAEQAIARSKAGITDDLLPAGPEIDLDVKAAPLHDLMRMMADTAGVNIVVPEHVDAKLTVKFKQARWDAALTAMLRAHGLWYRYRPNGKLLRIAPRQELDREIERARQGAK